MRFRFLLLLLAPPAGVASGQGTPTDSEKKGDAPSTGASTFDNVRPLLKAKCSRCHGDKAPKADLNLSTFDGVMKGGESGPVVVSGNADKSRLFEQVINQYPESMFAQQAMRESQQLKK